MYRFPSEEAKQELRTKYERLQEYMVAYNAINVVSERYEDLSPEEIWDEALSIVEEIRQVPHKKWKVQHVYSQLKRKYSAFEREDGTIIERTDKQQSITATLVLFDVVCMLSLAQKLEPEQAQQHPYYEHMKTILSFFCHSVLFEAMLAVLQQDEEDIEQLTGHELQVRDYMEEDVIQEEPERKERNLHDDKLRRIRLKKVYMALQEKLGTSFKGKSQWYYVYRMLAENNIYEGNTYTLFESDLIAIGVREDQMPDTNTFSRKQAQIKKETTFPNWKVKTGGKQNYLDQGLQIARIAFEIMFT